MPSACVLQSGSGRPVEWVARGPVSATVVMMPGRGSVQHEATNMMTRNETAVVVPYRGTRTVWRCRRLAVGAAVVVAVAVRFVHVVETDDTPLVRHLIGDAAGYYDWAQRIAEGQWVGSESFYQAPLYPYVLATQFKAFGVSSWTVRIVQAVWAGVAVWCLYLVTSRLFNRRCGLLAAWMLALYAPAIFFDGIVQKASLGCVLLCGLLAVTAKVAEAPRLPAIVAAGVLLGCLVLVRENALVWLPIMLVWIWFAPVGSTATDRFPAVGAYVLGVGLALLPVGVHNAVVGGEWSLSTFQAGPNFYIGNHHGAHGRYAPLVRGHETPAFERHDATMLAERAVGHKLSARAVSRYWLLRTLNDIRMHPLSWLGLMGQKLLMVVDRHEVADAESLYVYADSSVTLRVLGPVWNFGVLCPLAAMGIVLTRSRWRELSIYYALIASMILAVAIFYVMARYRFPLVPLLIPFAAVGCVKAWICVRARELRRLFGAVIVALIVAVVVNVPVHDVKRLNALAWMNVGVALAQGGDVAGATAYFRKAISGHPESAEANNNLAQALAIQGDFAGAIPHYETALAAGATWIGGDFNLAVALEQVGRRLEALKHFEKAVELNPSDSDAIEAVDRLRGAER